MQPAEDDYAKNSFPGHRAEVQEHEKVCREKMAENGDAVMELFLLRAGSLADSNENIQRGNVDRFCGHRVSGRHKVRDFN